MDCDGKYIYIFFDNVFQPTGARIQRGEPMKVVSDIGRSGIDHFVTGIFKFFVR